MANKPNNCKAQLQSDEWFCALCEVRWGADAEGILPPEESRACGTMEMLDDLDKVRLDAADIEFADGDIEEDMDVAFAGGDIEVLDEAHRIPSQQERDIAAALVGELEHHNTKEVSHPVEVEHYNTEEVSPPPRPSSQAINFAGHGFCFYDVLRFRYPKTGEFFVSVPGYASKAKVDISVKHWVVHPTYRAVARTIFEKGNEII